MNKTTPLDDSLNDEDLHALMDPSKAKIPPKLDQTMLAQAHDALKLDGAEKRVRSSWEPTWPQAFSTAAVLFIGVMLVPATMKKTELNRPQINGTSSATTADSIILEMVSETESTRAAGSAVNSASNSVSNASPAVRAAEAPAPPASKLSTQLREAAPMMVPAPLAPDAVVLSENTTAVAADSALTYPFRDSPELWMAEIKRLVDANELDLAREEMIEFNSRHPDHELLNELPKALR